MGRVGSFEEIAESCVFLAGDDASYFQGGTLIIDGGLW